MEKSQKVIATIIVIVLLIAGFYLITGAITRYTGFFINDMSDDDLRLCFSEQDITLYINSDKPAITLNKIHLQEYLEDFKIINCLRDNSYCKEISKFPTWIINSNKIERDISFEELSEYSNCKMI